MSMATMELANSSYSTGRETRTTQGDADSVQLQHFPADLRRRRSFRPRRVPHSQHSRLMDPMINQPIQLTINLTLDSSEKSKSKVDVEDKPQETVDPKVMSITGPKWKSTVRVFDPLDPDTSRIRNLAEVCYQRLLASGDVSSSSDKS